jgi:hypothetical protein
LAFGPCHFGIGCFVVGPWAVCAEACCIKFHSWLWHRLLLNRVVCCGSNEAWWGLLMFAVQRRTRTLFQHDVKNWMTRKWYNQKLQDQKWECRSKEEGVRIKREWEFCRKPFSQWDGRTQLFWWKYSEEDFVSRRLLAAFCVGIEGF